MEIGRKTLLTIVKYLSAELSASGWTNVSIVKMFPEDENKIVFSGSESGTVAIPAICVTQGQAYEGGLCGIGMEIHEHSTSYGILLYAQTDGQEMDLRQFIANRLYNYSGTLYNFPSGYHNVAVEDGSLKINAIRHRPVYDVSNPNTALRYAGLIYFNIATETT